MIHSFLENRSCQVSINGKNSAKFDVPAGVPQGSSISPVLYNIFTSDITVPDNGTDLALYADDTAIYSSATYPEIIIRKLQQSLNHMKLYFEKWKIKINGLKTQAAFFTRRIALQYLPDADLMFDNNSIPWEKSIKYLGVCLDKKLTFKEHTDCALQRSQKYIKILYSLINRKSKLNIINKRLLYITTFRSIITYACPVWNSCANMHKKKLPILQNKCLKIIYNLPWHYSTDELHSLADLPMLNDFTNAISSKFLSRCRTSTNTIINNLLAPIH